MKKTFFTLLLVLWAVSAWGAGATPVITSKTLFDNYSTLEQLGTGEDGNLRFRGEVIQGGGGGEPGQDGAAATITIGTTTTGAPGSSASVTNSGTSSAAVFDFTVPRGATGATGAQGSQGPQGPQGPQGVAGGSMAWRGLWDEMVEYYANDAVRYGSPASSFIAIATSTGAIPSSSPLSWEIISEAGATGSEGAQGPQGDTGPQGPQGFQGYSGAQGPAGPQGDTGPQGPAGNDGGTLAFKGAWSAFTNYSTLDSVTYNGSSFAAKLPSLNLPPWTPPAAPTTPQNNTWQLQAQKGDAGAQGAQGVAGPNSISTGTAVSVGSDTDIIIRNGSVAGAIPQSTFATAAQGATADTALQPGDIGTTVQGYNAGTVTAITDSTSTTSSTTAASATAVKAAKDAADAKLSPTGSGAELTGITATQVGALPVNDPTATGTLTAPAIVAAATLGSNLVTNGTFTTDLTGWTGTNWAQSSGAALHTAGNNASMVQSGTTATASTIYKVSFTVAGQSAGTVQINFGGGSTAAFTANGTYTAYITTVSTASLSVGIDSGGLFNGSVDDIVVQAVTVGSVGNSELSVDGAGNITTSGNVSMTSGNLSPVFLITASVNAAGQTPTMSGRRSRGTVATPTATLANDAIFTLSAIGYQSTTNAWLTASSYLQFVASENYTSTAKGSYVDIATTATGGTSRTVKARFWGSRAVSINPVTANHADPGPGSLALSGAVIESYTTGTGTAITIDASKAVTRYTPTNATTVTLPKTLPAGSTSLRISIQQGATPYAITWAVESGGSIGWGDVGAPATGAANKRNHVICTSDNTAATTTAAWDCSESGSGF